MVAIRIKMNRKDKARRIRVELMNNRNRTKYLLNMTNRIRLNISWMILNVMLKIMMKEKIMQDKRPTANNNQMVTEDNNLVSNRILVATLMIISSNKIKMMTMISSSRMVMMKTPCLMKLIMISMIQIHVVKSTLMVMKVIG